ncbi:MAG: peptidylprolyl isomerase [Nitrospiraceae bacterium]|nr:peptidylprolyl isomerase [Nitrospiraceae bacterium]
MKSRFFLTLFAVTLLFVQISTAEESDPVLAKAGEYVIKLSDLNRIISYYPADKQEYLRNNPEQKATLIKRLLEVKIIADVAKKEGFDKRPDIREQLDYMDNDFTSREYLAQVVTKNITVSDRDILDYYTANKEKFAVPEQVRARHILVKVSPKATDEEKKKAREKIEALRERALKGEDFAALAEEYTDDPGTKKRGGDTGYFSRGKMVKPFEEAAFSLKPGEISNIVETRFGYHIIKVEDHKAAGTMSLDEAKKSIEEYLVSELKNKKALEFIQKVEEKAKMEIYQDKITGTSPGK